MLVAGDGDLFAVSGVVKSPWREDSMLWVGSILSLVWLIGVMGMFPLGTYGHLAGLLGFVMVGFASPGRRAMMPLGVLLILYWLLGRFGVFTIAAGPFVHLFWLVGAVLFVVGLKRRPESASSV